MPGFERFGEAERKEVLDVLETGVLRRYDGRAGRKGKAVQMEEELAQRFQMPYAHLVSHGTAALSLGLSALGVGAGDEVILPTFTFVSSLEAVISVGAIPVFADINRSLALDPDSVASVVTPRTRAMVVTHPGGSMADLAPLADLARKHGFYFIEDVGQAIGGSYQGRPLGSWGDAGCFSFNADRLITCGEGGAVLMKDPDAFQRLTQSSDHGHDHSENQGPSNSHPFLGYNFRISELNAALGLAQIRRMDDWVAKQRKNSQLFFDSLKGLPIDFAEIPDQQGGNGAYLSYFLPSERLARRAKDALDEAGLPGQHYWYDDSWHYIRKWQHLQNGEYMFPLPSELRKRIMQQSNRAFATSDAIMSTCISSEVRLEWTEEQAVSQGTAVAQILESVLQDASNLGENP